MLLAAAEAASALDLPHGNPAGLLAVLKAWESCRPEESAIREIQLPALLPTISVHIPGGSRSPEHTQRLAHHFACKPVSYGCDTPGTSRGALAHAPQPIRGPFLQALRGHNGQVHFPYFWRAFRQAVDSVAGTDLEELPEAESSVCNILDKELDAFRDQVLHQLETTLAKSGQWGLPGSALEHVSDLSKKASKVPNFWQEAGKIMSASFAADLLSLQDVSSVMLTCLCSAVSLLTSPSNTLLLPPVGAPVEVLGDDDLGIPVYLNIYDVSHGDSVQWLNAVFAHWLAPVKFGGVFHAGVEIDGLEWCFGSTKRETLPGVFSVVPRSDPQHHFRQTVYLGKTQMPMDRIASTITDLVEDYPGCAYDVLRLNCCHFADDFVRRLGVGPVPTWVHRLARLAAGADGAIQAAFGTSSSELCQVGSYRSGSCQSLVSEKDENCLVMAEPVVGENDTGPGPL